MVAAMTENEPGVQSETSPTHIKKFGIHRREAGLKPISKPAPP
jgi:hypothetical protein